MFGWRNFYLHRNGHIKQFKLPLFKTPISQIKFFWIKRLFCQLIFDLKTCLDFLFILFYILAYLFLENLIAQPSLPYYDIHLLTWCRCPFFWALKWIDPFTNWLGLNKAILAKPSKHNLRFGPLIVAIHWPAEMDLRDLELNGLFEHLAMSNWKPSLKTPFFSSNIPFWA